MAGYLVSLCAKSFTAYVQLNPMPQLELLGLGFIFLNAILFVMRSQIAPPVTRFFNIANRSQPGIPQLTTQATQKTLAIIGATNTLATVVALLVIHFYRLA